ncbi:metal-dependent hydrolase [Halomonas sp. SSL-5]|uniref:metal-dependent hydrolase n=1 Tax=Halomonas sp. SSL-5 TaxID=3065855 RepID=UPI00273A54ED|nr:metal-dependent hydrolase [Halomonas sp. SSL-5]MDY7117830.1 metal-dependent hydrolase [Halomonas sp. SSL-5]
MADFRTHLGVAAAGGVVVAHGGWQAGLWDAWQALPMLALVAFGGILPDIDADSSKAIRLVFNLLAVIAVVAGALLLQGWLSLGGLLLACVGLYLGVRHLGGALFARLTVHRGIWHSLLAAALCGLATTALSHHLLAQPDVLAWGHGMALSLGFVLHLLLDELYSVDLTGARIKRSFGSALKPLDWRSPGNSLVMLATGANLLPWLPAWAGLGSLLDQGAALWR